MSDQAHDPGFGSAERGDQSKKPWVAPKIERVELLSRTNKVLALPPETSSFGPLGS